MLSNLSTTFWRMSLRVAASRPTRARSQVRLRQRMQTAERLQAFRTARAARFVASRLARVRLPVESTEEWTESGPLERRREDKAVRTVSKSSRNAWAPYTHLKQAQRARSPRFWP